MKYNIGIGLQLRRELDRLAWVAAYDEITTRPSRKPLEVFTRRRPTPKELDNLIKAEDQRVKDKTRSFWLPTHLTGWPTESWPESLHFFASRLPDNRVRSRYAPTLPEIVSNLRKYYPEDQVLTQFAEFLESAYQDDAEVTFATEHKHVLLPRSPDGSINIFGK